MCLNQRRFCEAPVAGLKPWVGAWRQAQASRSEKILLNLSM